MSRGAIVLCGGHSRRMGRDKASLPFGTEPMLERVVRVVQTSVDAVCLVAREGQDVEAWRAGALAHVPLARDPAEGLGPLAGLCAGLEALDVAHAFLCACDMPLLRPQFVDRLFELGRDHELAVLHADGHPMVTAAVYARSVLTTARSLLDAGERRPRALIERVDTRVIEPHELRDVDPELESLIDCDTPASYRGALERAGLEPPAWVIEA